MWLTEFLRGLWSPTMWLAGQSWAVMRPCSLFCAWKVLRAAAQQITSVQCCKERVFAWWLLWSYLLGLLAMIKCSICSYQCDNWYSSNRKIACHANFSVGRLFLELARGHLTCRPSIALSWAWHTLRGNIININIFSNIYNIYCYLYRYMILDECVMKVVYWYCRIFWNDVQCNLNAICAIWGRPRQKSPVIPKPARIDGGRSQW